MWYSRKRMSDRKIARPIGMRIAKLTDNRIGKRIGSKTARLTDSRIGSRTGKWIAMQIGRWIGKRITGLIVADTTGNLNGLNETRGSRLES